MSNQSNNQGRAYEYICLLTMCDEILQYRPAVIEKNSSYYAAQRAWEAITEELQNTLKKSAMCAIHTIFDLEPLIIEDGNDQLDLFIQPDSQGEEGDPRDILVVRRKICWEIGLSIKHNHFAVKHSRLSKSLDFCNRWFGIPCSDQYWSDVKPIFDYLKQQKNAKAKWRDIPNKDLDVYRPLLKAFSDEINRAVLNHPDIPKKMVEYLLGKFDFYKVISVDSKRITQILSYNLRGTLNRPSVNQSPKISVPVANLPTRIVSLDFKPGSNNTIELYMDEGWQFSFRIHNASTVVETSLKFDVQIIGMPASIIAINCQWI